MKMVRQMTHQGKNFMFKYFLLGYKPDLFTCFCWVSPNLQANNYSPFSAAKVFAPALEALLLYLAALLKLPRSIS